MSRAPGNPARISRLRKVPPMRTSDQRRQVAPAAGAQVSFLSNLAAFVRLPRRTRADALEAALLLLVARLLVDLVRMPSWRRWVDIEAGAEPPPVERRTDGPARVGRIVRKVAPRLPFSTRCLARAMAAHWMLRRRGVASRISLGVRRAAPSGGALEYHAWLATADGVAVIGAADAETYRRFGTATWSNRI